MAKTMTVGELMEILSAYPSHVSVFFYDVDKEKDSNIELVELVGPHSNVEENGTISWHTPYYCKGNSNIEEHWMHQGIYPILCMREKTLWEAEQNDC